MHRTFITVLTLMLITLVYSSSEWTQVQDLPSDQKRVNLVDSDIYSTTLSFHTDGYHAVGSDDGLQLRLENGAQLLQQGNPDLAMTSASIIIPDDQRMDVRVIRSNYEEFQNIDVLPSKGNLSRLIDPSTIPYEYGDVYNQDTFFPGELASLREPYILRDVRGTAVVVYPLQYNPVTKVLRVYTEITVEVYSTGMDDVNVLNRENLPDTRPREFQNIYQSHFINTDRDVRFEYLVDQGNMLIICNEAFFGAMEPFVEWKTLKGIPLEMVGVSEAGGNANAIKNYITDYYNDNGLTFVLLVGDVAQVPSISVGGALSDPSYGFISGNDSYAEVIIGRFSGQTPSEIETQVERTIDYERYPTTGDWHTSALGVASNQGPGWGGLTDDAFNEQIICPLLNEYTYESCQVIADPSGTLTQGVNAINNGVGIINYTGHGWQLGWGNGAPLGNSDVHNLTNSGKLPFVITVGCNVGEFDAYDESFSESWLRATHNGDPSGGIVHFGSTISQSWEPPMHGQYGINMILTESYDEHLTRTIGGMATNGCMYMNDMQGSSGINETNYWTYFGDPSVVFASDNPQNLNVNYESTLLIGQESMTITTGNDGDLVALSRNGELLTSGYTGANGVATLSLASATDVPGTVQLVVTAYNHFPYEAEITVISPDGPWVLVNGYTTNDNDIQFGETIQVTLDISNIGTDPANGLELDLTTEDPFVTIMNGNLALGNLGAGQSSSTQNIEVIISANIPDGHQFTLNCELSTLSDNWQSEILISASAPQLSAENVSLDAYCGTLWPGSEAEVSLNITNSGSAALDLPSADISLNGFGEVSNLNYDPVGQLGVGESMDVSFDINVNNAVQAGTAVMPNVIITSDAIEGYSIPVSVEVVVGLLVENFETGDFSCQSWEESGHSDWSITASNAYDGMYCAKSGQISDSQSSTLSLTMEVTGAGELEFQYRVSAEYSTSGDFFYDGLEFYINGNLMDQFQSETNGDSPWKHAFYEITEGTHTFLWNYIKDGAGGGTDCDNTPCEDAAYIDDIKFPIAEPTGTPGDLNGDSVINVLDVIITVNIILDEGFDSLGDLNSDNEVNVLDIVALINLILDV